AQKTRGPFWRNPGGPFFLSLGEKYMNYNLKLRGKIIEVFGHQWRFAQFLGIPEAEVSRVVNQRKAISQKRKREWAKALNVQPGEIFNE
ncbi:MAG: DUF739 family protein, partial [Pseudomonadota bacterium]